jgi:hypothetical protein
MLDDDERQAVVWRHGGKELHQRFETTGRGANANNADGIGLAQRTTLLAAVDGERRPV